MIIRITKDHQHGCHNWKVGDTPNVSSNLGMRAAIEGWAEIEDALKTFKRAPIEKDEEE